MSGLRLCECLALFVSTRAPSESQLPREVVMGVWPFLQSAAWFFGGLALIAALVWAARERGRIYCSCRDLESEYGERDFHLPQWCVAVSTVAGCA
jgi:hypothetical protein